jgi:hypothetical protein
VRHRKIFRFSLPMLALFQASWVSMLSMAAAVTFLLAESLIMRHRSDAKLARDDVQDGDFDADSVRVVS